MMDIDKINYFVEKKKSEGKRVAVVDYEGGYHELIDFNAGDHAKWDQAKIDAWNTEQGLDENTVDMIINQSMWPSHDKNGRVA